MFLLVFFTVFAVDNYAVKHRCSSEVQFSFKCFVYFSHYGVNCPTGQPSGLPALQRKVRSWGRLFTQVLTVSPQIKCFILNTLKSHSDPFLIYCKSGPCGFLNYN